MATWQERLRARLGKTIARAGERAARIGRRLEAASVPPVEPSAVPVRPTPAAVPVKPPAVPVKPPAVPAIPAEPAAPAVPVDPKTLADLERLDVFLRAKRDADLDLKDLEQEVWNERRRVTKELMDRGVPYESLPPEPLPPEWERMMERLDPPVLDPKPPQQGGVPKQPDSKLQGTHVFIRFGAPARVYAELYNIWDRERLGKSRSDTVTKPYFPFARARRDADDPGEVIPPEVMLDIDAFMRWATSRGMVDGLSVEVEGWSNPSWAGREWSDRNRAFASAPDLAHRLDLAGVDEQGQNVWTYDPDADPDNRESDE